jgi:hypothetical protein
VIRLVHRYLDPEESLLEILFGLVMALTMTVGARIFWHEGAVEAQALVLALVGCNLAWGMIDGMFYLVGTRFGRNRATRLVRRLRRARSDEEAFAIVDAEIDLDETVLTEPKDRERLKRLLVQVLRRAEGGRAPNTRRELVAAGVVCALVTAAALPGVLPLLVIADGHTALVIANALQLALLFGVGYAWAGFAGAPALRTGAAVTLLGLSLVAVAVALGG